MAKIEGRATLEVSVTIALTEAEIGALDALAGYGTDEFLKIFYEHMGRTYLEKHESGLRTLFHSIRNGPTSLISILRRARDARQAFYGEKSVVATPQSIEAKE